MVRKWFSKWIEFSHWLKRTEIPPLVEDEQIVLDSPAIVIDWYPLPVKGRLLLTTQRLFYISTQFRFLPFYSRFFRYLPGLYISTTSVEIYLGDIKSLGRQSRLRGLYGGFPGPPIFTVTINNGDHHAFQTPLRDAFEGEIMRLLKSGTVNHSTRTSSVGA